MQTHSDTAYQFDQFEVNAASGELFKNGKRVRLQEQPFRLLVVLLENAGEVVTREDLRSRIWQEDTFVDFDGSLRVAVRKLREALDDDAENPRFVETIPRHGYRFLCPIEVSEAGPVQPEVTAAPIGGLAVQGSAMLDSPSTGETEEKTDQPSKVTRWKFRKWLLPGLGFAVLLILAGIFISGHYSLRLHRPWLVREGTLTGRARTVTLTNVRGLVYSPVFSPDGKHIAFFWNGPDQNKVDIYVQPIGGEDPVRLTFSGARHICCLAWSPDGQRISFVRCDNGVGTVYTVPALGGSERKLTDVTCSEFDTGAPAWTIDGKSLLLLDRCVPGKPIGVVVFSPETGQRHCLTMPSSNDTSDDGLSLSPDGRTVAFRRFSLTSFVDEIWIIPLQGGTPRRLTADGNLIMRMMWAADGRRIIFLSTRGGGGWHFDRLWNVSIAGGEIQPETAYPHFGALSRDGQRLAYVAFGNGEPEGIWRTDLSGPGGHVLARKKIVASPEYNAQPQLSPDETKIVFSSERSGNSEIWRSEADGSNPIQLGSFGGEHGGTPRWSPDGGWIVFDRYPGQHPQIYVMDAEGRNMRAMTDGDGNNCVPSWSRDGESIYFGSARSGSWQIWKQSVHGGGAVQITQHGGFTGFESYDGKTFYYSKVGDDDEGLWSVPADGGAETLVTPALRSGYWGAWAVSETGIYLIDDDVLPRPTIEFYNFRTRRLTAVMQIEYSPLNGDPSLDASRDGRIVLFAQYRPQSSIAMVENFQ